MLAKRNQMKLKRILSTLLAVVMLLGLLPMGALASTWTPGTPRSQVAENNYDWENERTISKAESKLLTVDGAQVPAIVGEGEKPIYPFGGLAVTAEKSAEQAMDKDGNLLENTFDVNVTITTNKLASDGATAADAAVVLVLDTSGSMGGTPIRDLQAAAKDFLKAFADVGASGAKRYVSLVTFAGSAEQKSGWIDVTNQANYNTIWNYLNKLEAGGSTNTDDGLNYANNLLTDTALSKVKGQDGNLIPSDSRYVILMTDGYPEDNSGRGSNTTTVHYEQPARSIGQKSYPALTGDYRLQYNFGLLHHNNRNWLNPIIEANKITGADGGNRKAQLYSVYLGEADDKFTGYNEYSPLSSKDEITVFQNDWMRYFSDALYTASDSGKLGDLFTKIVQLIENRAQAYIFNDPMGTGVKFDGFIGDQGQASINADGNKVTWDLKAETNYTESGSEGNKIYTYNIKYRVRLENTALAGVVCATDGNTTYYPLNKDTTLTYLFEKTLTDNNGVSNTYSSALGTAHLSVPAVEPLFVNDWGFQKVDEKNAAISGAAFTLTNQTETAAVKTVTSTNLNGAVTFSSIPSGHTYSLIETTTPDQFIAPTDPLGDVVVAWGAVKSSPVVDNRIVNRMDPKNIDITISKIWHDGDRAGLREEIGVLLKAYADGTTALPETYDLRGTITDKGNNIWNCVFENVSTVVTDPESDFYGKPITYIAEETTPLTHYKANSEKVTVKVENGVGTASFTNLLDDKIETLTVSKVWEGPDDLAGNPNAYVTVQLYADSDKSGAEVKLNRDNNWQHAYTNLSVFAEGSTDEIVYTVKEVEASDGTNTATVSSGTVKLGNVTYGVSEGSAANGYVVTNSMQQVDRSASVTKVWNDNGNTDVRPVSITVSLYANGKPVAEHPGIELNQDTNNWSAVVSGLPTYDENGTITYTFREDGESGGTVNHGGQTYTVAYDDETGDYDTVITNTITGNYEGGIAVIKTWVDDPVYSVRPTAGVTFELKRNGQVYTSAVLENQDYSTDEGMEYLDEWTGNLFGTLPMYDEKGEAYTYTLGEVGDDGSASYGSGTIALNGNEYSYEIGALTAAGFAVTNTIADWADTTSISGTKSWVGAAYEGDVVLYLVPKGTTDTTDAPYTTLNEDGTFKFENLPLYDNGNHIDYKNYQVIDAVEGYTMTQAGNGENGWQVVNTLNQVSDVTITVVKEWFDEAANLRPETITVKLIANGKTEVAHYALSAEEGWSHTFDGLPRYDETTRQPIFYSVVEELGADSHYNWITTEYDHVGENGFDRTVTIHNEIKNYTVPFTVAKTWLDADGAPQGELSVNVYGTISGLLESVTLDAGSGWTALVDLPKYGVQTVDGVNTYVEQDYYVRELDDGAAEAAPGSVSTILGRDYAVSYDGGAIVNKRDHGDENFVNLNFSKSWWGPRPDSVQVGLFVNGELQGEPVTLTSANADASGLWTGTFGRLPARDGNDNLIPYKIFEVDAQGRPIAEGQTITLDNGVTYTVTYGAGGIINNKVVQDEVTINGEKLWIDASEVALPDQVVIQLLRGETVVDSVTLPQTSDEEGFNPWAFAFTAPMYDQDGLIEYHVHEFGETGGHVQYGNDHFDVTYSEMNGDYVQNVTNAYTGTDVYSYIVERYYSYTLDGHTDTYTDHDAARTYGTAGQPVSVDPADFKTYGGKTYGISAVKLDGTELPTGESVDFALEANVSNVVQIYYTLNETTPVSYYRVDRVYNHYLDGELTGSASVTGAQQSAVTGTTIPAQDTDALKNQDGYGSYSYAGGNGALTLERAGETYVLTLTYELHDVTPPIPGEYSYRVDRVYTHYQDGVQDGSVTVTGGKTTGEENDVVLIGESDINGFKAADGRDGYTFVSGSPTIRTETPENPEGVEAIGVRLEQSGTTYVITLSYELRDTTPPTPPTPPDPEVKTFTLTLHYYDKDSGRELTTVPFTMTGNEGSAWDVSEKAERQFYGYVFDSWEGYGDGLTGIFEDHDVTIDVYYVRDAEIPDEEVPDEPVPLGPQPNTPDDGTDIGDNDVPLNPGPGGGDDDVTIEDGGVPLGNLPQTGFAAAPVNPAVTLGMLAMSLSMAAAGLAITYTRKVKEEEE